MLRCLILSALLLAACAPREPVVRPLVPDVPTALRSPCKLPDLGRVQTEGQLSDLLIDYEASATCANGKIASIDKILTLAEERAK